MAIVFLIYFQIIKQKKQTFVKYTEKLILKQFWLSSIHVIVIVVVIIIVVIVIVVVVVIVVVNIVDDGDDDHDEGFQKSKKRKDAKCSTA